MLSAPPIPRFLLLALLCLGCASAPPSSEDDSAHTTQQDASASPLCPANLGDESALYFKDAVQLRLPSEVPARTFREMTPFMARLMKPITTAPCDEAPAPTIRAMYLHQVLAAGQGTPAHIRDGLLDVTGYSQRTLVEETDTQQVHRAIFDIPPKDNDPSPTPARVLIVVQVSGEMVYAMSFEASLEDWPRLLETFDASARSLSGSPTLN